MTSLSALSTEQVATSSENHLLTLEEWLDKATIPVEDKEMYVKIVDDKVAFVPTFDESCSMSDLFSFTSSHVSTIQKLENCDKLKEVAKEVHDRVIATLAWHNILSRGMCELKLFEINSQISNRKDELLNALKKEEEKKKSAQTEQCVPAVEVTEIQKNESVTVEELPKQQADCKSTLDESSEKIIIDIKKLAPSELEIIDSLLSRYTEAKEKEELPIATPKVMQEVLDFLGDIKEKEEHSRFLDLFTKEITSLRAI